MKRYLLDTNICIYFIKWLFELNKKIAEIGSENCFISEITVAELKYGVENSKTIEAIKVVVDAFIQKFAIIPIYNSLDIYAKEKTKLRQSGQLIDDFDILITATAVANNMTMVTNNTKQLRRLENIQIEDWTILAKK
ncbi:MAG: type II toxin-antitoxin system VapC family toxin [Chitinophagaceae bacterium]